MKKSAKELEKQELIHVKLEYSEVLQSKKDILSLQLGLLNVLKTIKKYHFLRKEELKNKEELHQKSKQTIANLKKLQTTLPKLKIPALLKKAHIEPTHTISPKQKTSYEPEDSALEMQLQEIQNRLRDLQK